MKISMYLSRRNLLMKRVCLQMLYGILLNLIMIVFTGCGVDPEGILSRYSLQAPTNTIRIGTDTTLNLLILTDPGLADKHCRLTARGGGAFDGAQGLLDTDMVLDNIGRRVIRWYPPPKSGTFQVYSDIEGEQRSISITVQPLTSPFIVEQLPDSAIDSDSFIFVVHAPDAMVGQELDVIVDNGKLKAWTPVVPDSQISDTALALMTNGSGLVRVEYIPPSKRMTVHFRFRMFNSDTLRTLRLI